MSTKSPFAISALCLTAAQRNPIERLCDDIAAACKTTAAESAAHAKAQRQVDDLAEEIAALETTVDVSNTAAVQVLSAKREQHSLMEKRLPAPKPVALDAAATEKLRTLCAEMGKLFKAHIEQAQREFARTLAPLFTDRGVKDPWNEAFHFLNTAPLLRQASQRFILNVRPEGNRLPDPVAAVALARALLAGENVFVGNWQNL